MLPRRSYLRLPLATLGVYNDRDLSRHAHPQARSRTTLRAGGMSIQERRRRCLILKKWRTLSGNENRCWSYACLAFLLNWAREPSFTYKTQTDRLEHSRRASAFPMHFLPSKKGGTTRYFRMLQVNFGESPHIDSLSQVEDWIARL